MSSTLKQAIEALKTRIAGAYEEVSAKGGTLPVTQDSANLPSAIASIPSGGSLYDALSQLGFSQAEISELTDLETPTADEIAAAAPYIGRAGSGSRAWTGATYSQLRYIPKYTATDRSIEQHCWNMAGAPLCEIYGGIVQRNGLSFSGSAFQFMYGGFPFLRYFGGDVLDLSDVTNFREAFYGMSCLLRIPKLKFSSVLHASDDMWRAFYKCNQLRYIDFMDSDFSQVTTWRETFYNCYCLREIKGVLDFSGNTTNYTSTVFNNCFRLTYVRIKNMNENLNLSTCNSLDYDSLLYCVQNLANVTGKTLTLGTINRNKLNATTEGQNAIAAAQAIGWTIA